MTPDQLKASGQYFEAGYAAAALRLPAFYGCHFGLRSDLARARTEFARGHASYGKELVTRKNLLSGKEYQEARDTPLCCSPSSETYWSM